MTSTVCTTRLTADARHAVWLPLLLSVLVWSRPGGGVCSNLAAEVYLSEEKTKPVAPADGYMTIRMAYAQFCGEDTRWYKAIVGRKGQKDVVVQINCTYGDEKAGGVVAWGRVRGTKGRASVLQGQNGVVLPRAPVRVSLGEQWVPFITASIVAQDAKERGILDAVTALSDSLLSTALLPGVDTASAAAAAAGVSRFQATAQALVDSLWPSEKTMLDANFSLRSTRAGKGKFTFPQYVVLYDPDNPAAYENNVSHGKLSTVWTELSTFAKFPDDTAQCPYLRWQSRSELGCATSQSGSSSPPAGLPTGRMEQGNYILLEVETMGPALTSTRSITDDATFSQTVGLSLVRPAAQALKSAAAMGSSKGTAAAEEAAKEHADMALQWVRDTYGAILNERDQIRMVLFSWDLAVKRAGLTEKTLGRPRCVVERIVGRKDKSMQ